MEVHAFAIYSLFMIATHAYLWTWLWTLILASPHVFCESLMNFVKPFQLFFIQKWPNLKSKSGSNLQILNRPACMTRFKIHYKKKVVTGTIQWFIGEKQPKYFVIPKHEIRNTLWYLWFTFVLFNPLQRKNLNICVTPQKLIT